MTIFRNLWNFLLRIFGCRVLSKAGTFSVKTPCGESFEVGDAVYWDKDTGLATSYSSGMSRRGCIRCGGPFDGATGSYMHTVTCEVLLDAARRKLIEMDRNTPTFQDILDEEIEKGLQVFHEDETRESRRQEQEPPSPVGRAVDSIFQKQPAMPPESVVSQRLRERPMFIKTPECCVGSVALVEFNVLDDNCPELTFRCEKCGEMFTRKGTSL